MKLKHQLSIFNAFTRLLLILLLWFALPVLVEKVVSNHIDSNLLEKKQKFIKNLDKEEINDFIVKNDSSDTYASFSMLHNDYVLLTIIKDSPIVEKTQFIEDYREIEDDDGDFRILQYNFTYEKIGYQLEIGSSLIEINEIIFIIRFFILIALVVVIVLTFLLDTIYIDYLLKPFNKIIDKKIRRINEPEAFDSTPILAHSSDFQELDTVLNQMMNRLAEVFKKEKQFIANVSHELLTPIALLKNRFENLIQNKSLDDNAIDKIASSLKNLDLLKKVINNLLLISRIDNNQYESNETLNLKEIILDLLVNLEDRILENHLTITININHNFIFKGNKTLMHVLFYNLIVNAIKYNQEQGEIRISDGFFNEKYYISIIDTGIGMSAIHLKKIFERFNRASKDQEGQGLGLAIAASIASFHRIEIISKSVEGQGSEFVLKFK